MENAGAGCADLAYKSWKRAGGRGNILVFCGPGGNGGDGYVLARHLHLAAVPVSVIHVGVPAQGSDAADARRAWLALDVRSKPSAPTLVIDALLGTGVARPLSGPVLKAVNRVNALRVRGAWVLSIDLPTGLDTDSGVPYGIAVKAHVTATIAARKRGLTVLASKPYRGRVVVVPFGAPAHVRG
jgi:NAD(P)H-hydrate epimerase